GTISANAQIEECGTPGISPVQLQEFLEEIDTSAAAIVAGASLAATSPWRICVWFYHLRNSDGSSDDQDTDPEQFIGAVNTYFGGTFEFVVCGTTNIDNDDYSTLDIGSNSSNLSDLWTDIASLNESLSENCVRVFMLGDGSIHLNGVPKYSGYAHNPLQYDNPAVFLAYLDGRLWAHELGHYMGLPHTFEGGASNQYVHDFSTPVLIGGVSYTCIHTGDGFCDTPADPDDNGCGFNGQCQLVSCNPALDPLGVPYSPDPTLIMSYYGNCRDKFSGEQHQRMRTHYFISDFEFLRNPADECITPKYGFIERNCEGYVPDDAIEPLVYVPVEVRDELQPYCDPQDNKTDSLGRYLIDPCPMTGVARRILPDRNFGNDPLNGVTTLDLVLINKHILGVSKFENPFQLIAADANNSASVTTFDIVELRKLILGLYTQLPIGISWRYVPKLFTKTQPFRNDFFDDPFSAELADPFQSFTRKYKSNTQGLNVPNTDSWMDFVTLVKTSSLAGNEDAWSFTGIKIGDVNCNATREGDPIRGEDHEFQLAPGSNAHISTSAPKLVQVLASAPVEVLAWQFGARYASDSLTISNLSPGTEEEKFDEDHFHIAPFDSLLETGAFRALWFSEDGETVDIDSTVLFEFEVEANEHPVDLEERFRLDNDVLPFLFYDEDGELIEDVTLSLVISNISHEFKTLYGPLSPAPKPLRVKTYPIPFTSNVGFFFDIARDEQVRLDVFDAMGTLVNSVTETLPSGPHELQVKTLAQYPPGLYWYVLRAGELTARGKLSKR
ncbi:MAG: hypothetical protein L6Q97_17045, partial [Thermoanaerobaculia bacterium]|nr:hypothetical protein [Thermoanaerobaculia bacterium]